MQAAISVRKIKALWIFLWLLGAIGLQLLPNPAAAQSQIDQTYDPCRMGWARLLFKGKTFMGSVSVDVALAFISPDEAKRTLIASPKGIPVPMESANVGHLTVHRTIDPTFRSTDIIEEDKIWFNPSRASALGRIRTRRGDDDFLKKYRFTDLGVFRIHKEPADNHEANLSPDDWTKTGERFYAHDLGQMGCAVASERSILLFAASAGNFSHDPQPVSLCVFGKRQLFRARLSAAGVHALQVNYLEKKGDTEAAIKARVEASKIALEAQPLKAALDEVENFSFLGLHSNIAFFIDPASGLPLQISGKLSKLGTMHFKLTEVMRPTCGD